MKKQKVTKPKKSTIKKDLRPSLNINLAKRSGNTAKTLPDIMIPTPFEPKVSNRWICYVEDSEGNNLIPAYLIKECSRAHLYRTITPAEFTTIALNPVVETRLRKSPESNNLNYGSLILSVYDPIKPSSSKIISDLINKNVSFNVRLVFLDPVGKRIEEWIYKGCRIKYLTFSMLKWGPDSDPSTINVQISVSSVKIK